MKKINYKIDYHIILLILFVLVTYHFMCYNPYSMKWDMAEQYLPWRFFISKSINNGSLPFWNPYQLGGYPTFADPQSGVWYYPTWVISLLFGYTMSIIQLEILFALVFGCIGFYKLSKSLNFSKSISSILAISYISSGFIVGNAQHLTWIYAAVFIPWLIYYYIQFRTTLKQLSLLPFLIINYFFLSSSYPAFAIIFYYIIGIDQLILFIKDLDKFEFIKQRIIWLLLFLLTTLPISYSVISSSEYFSRGSGITLERALQHPFSINSTLSFLFPFSTFKNPDFFKTDLSMANGYFGLLGFLFLIFGCVRKLKKNEILLIGLSTLFLLLSFGSETPLRELFYNYLPGFNLFRFPSLFRLFFIITSLLFVGYTIQYIVNFNKWKDYRLFLSLLLLLSILILILNKSEVVHVNNLENFSFLQHICFQLIIHSVLLLILIINKKLNLYYLFFVIAIDMFVSVNLNSHASMVLDVKSEQVDNLIKNKDQIINVPSTTPLISHIDQSYQYRWPLNWNMNCYFGEIATDGYNPFVLKTFNNLSESNIRDSVWTKPFYYLSNEENTSTEIISFKPDNIQLKVYTDTNNILTIAQNPFPGWSVYVNNKKSEIFISNISHQSVKIQKGENIIEWKYSNSVINNLFILHLLILLALLTYYFRLYYQIIILQKIK